MERKRKAGEEVSVVSLLPVVKRGQPLLLGDTLDSEIKSYIRSGCQGGGLVTMEITMAAARAIVRKYNQLMSQQVRKILIKITLSWAKSLLYCMKFVKSRDSTTIKYLVNDFEATKTILS